MSSSRRQPVRTAERVADHRRRGPLRHDAPPGAAYPSASAPVATDFPRCNPTEATVKGSEAPRLHALLPMSASACGALVRLARVAETQPALFVHPAARHWRRG
jgi:ribosomal protein L39E